MEKSGFFTVAKAMDHLKLPAYVKGLLREMYSEPHRAYHNLQHLENMLRWVPKDHPQLEVILEAVLWHDVVYPNVPAPAGLFEALSIAEYTLYSFYAGRGTPELDPRGRNAKNYEHERLVIEAINASSRHDQHQRGLSETTQFFLDLDLQSFAQPWEEMRSDSQAVVAELHPIFGETFYLGNKLFLEKLLARPQIYYTAPVEWEKRARTNIQKRICEIEAILDTVEEEQPLSA